MAADASGDGTTAITDEERRTVDGDELTDALGLDADEIAERKAFTGFTEEDERRVAEMGDVFERVAADLVDDFYDHLVSYGDSQAILERSDKTIEALKRTQRQYLVELGAGEYGQAYFDQRARVGKIHDLLEMPPKFYLAAYVRYYEGLSAAIAEDVKSEYGVTDGNTEAAVDAALARAGSVLKLLNLDQQVAIDTYIQSYNEQLQEEVERRRALTEMVSEQVAAPIDELHEMSADVADRSAEINDEAETQAEEMQSVAGEVANLSATVEEIASTADEVEETTHTARELASNGRESATRAIDVMENVGEAASDVGDEFDRLQDRVGEIDEVVEVINELTEQTNLLALNASIEAARAGEAGKGFAVVADEVKSLAEESREQAGQIEEVVHRIQSDTRDTVESLDETNGAIERAVEQVDAAMEDLADIADIVAEAADGVAEVANATDAQATSTEEVASMVDAVVTRTETVRDAITDIAAANRQQTERVDEISRAVDRLGSGDSYRSRE